MIVTVVRISKFWLCSGSTHHVLHTIPVWVAKAMRTYYLGARDNFLMTSGKELPFLRRMVPGLDKSVITKKFFVNSKGNTEFRAGPYRTKTHDKIKSLRDDAFGLTVLRRIVGEILPMPDLNSNQNPSFMKPMQAMNEVKRVATGYSDVMVRDAVRQRFDYLRHALATVRACLFLEAHPGPHSNRLTNLINDFYNRQDWPTRDISTVIHQIERWQRLGESTRRPHPVIIRRTGDEQRDRRSYSTMTVEEQTHIQDRIRTQEWDGVTFCKFEKMGRGLVATKHFERGDIIVDYHGKVVKGVKIDDYLVDPDIKPEFCFEIRDSPNGKRIIDASSETCDDHPENQCLGRLANHAKSKHSKGPQNAKAAEVTLSIFQPPEHYIILKARRAIVPFEQILFDYGDAMVQRVFGDTGTPIQGSRSEANSEDTRLQGSRSEANSEDMPLRKSRRSEANSEDTPLRGSRSEANCEDTPLQESRSEANSQATPTSSY